MTKEQSNIKGTIALIVTLIQLTCPYETLLDTRSNVARDCQRLKKILKSNFTRLRKNVRHTFVALKIKNTEKQIIIIVINSK